MLNIPKMVLENQRVLKVKIGVLLVIARSLLQMASALQKVEVLRGPQNDKLIGSGSATQKAPTLIQRVPPVWIMTFDAVAQSS
jgi:hypothetical protein